MIAGKPVVGVRNVTQPTMTVYSPKGKNTGVAVVVFPGGGYQSLAIDLEGTEVCDWLSPRGITCVVSKYRVTDGGNYPKSGPYPESPMALDDAQRTVGLVRFHAAEWHIDPRKIGVLGFSAGGHLSVAMSVHFEKRLYRAVDAADQVSCRPDFAVAIYPGHLSLPAAEWDAKRGARKFVIPHPQHQPGTDANLASNPDLRVTSETPPAFLLQAEDDHVDSVYDSAVLLHCLAEGWGSWGDAFVCAGRTCVWAAAHGAPDNRMASIGGDVAEDHRDDSRGSALGLIPARKPRPRYLDARP